MIEPEMKERYEKLRAILKGAERSRQSYQKKYL